MINAQRAAPHRHPRSSHRRRPARRHASAASASVALAWSRNASPSRGTPRAAARRSRRWRVHRAIERQRVERPTSGGDRHRRRNRLATLVLPAGGIEGVARCRAPGGDQSLGRRRAARAGGAPDHRGDGLADQRVVEVHDRASGDQLVVGETAVLEPSRSLPRRRSGGRRGSTRQRRSVPAAHAPGHRGWRRGLAPAPAPEPVCNVPRDGPGTSSSASNRCVTAPSSSSRKQRRLSPVPQLRRQAPAHRAGEQLGGQRFSERAVERDDIETRDRLARPQRGEVRWYRLGGAGGADHHDLGVVHQIGEARQAGAVEQVRVVERQRRRSAASALDEPATDAGDLLRAIDGAGRKQRDQRTERHVAHRQSQRSVRCASRRLLNRFSVSASSRVLPTPGSPANSTPRPSSASERAWSSSSTRPTSRVPTPIDHTHGCHRQTKPGRRGRLLRTRRPTTHFAAPPGAGCATAVTCDWVVRMGRAIGHVSSTP